MCLYTELTKIIWKHHPVNCLNVNQTAIVAVLRNKGPKTAKQMREELPHLSYNTIKVELYKLTSNYMIHSGEGRNRHYAALEDTIPKRAPEIRSGLGADLLKIIEKGPIKEGELYKMYPKDQRKNIKNALYRLRGQVEGYSARVIRTANLTYKVKT